MPPNTITETENDLCNKRVVLVLMLTLFRRHRLLLREELGAVGGTGDWRE